MIRPSDNLPDLWGAHWVDDFRRQMDSLSRAMFTDAGEGARGLFVPVDVVTQDGNLVVRAEIPGMAAEDIDVSVANGALIIRGERRHEDVHESENVHRIERRYGSFYRSIPLPESVDEDQIVAEYKNGVLEVTVPGAGPKGEGRKIPVNIGGKVKKALSGSRRKR